MLQDMRIIAVGILMAYVAAIAGAAGQQPPSFRGGSDSVRVFVTVTDRDGRLVTTLNQDMFEVRDEGKPQPIALFDKSPQPIRLIVMLDVSGSMDGNLPLLRAAAAQLFTRLQPQDGVRVGAFGHEVTISPAFTRDPVELTAALPSTIAPDAPTPLWRAIDDALGAFGAGDDRRKVILVLSDGKDTGTFNLRQRPSSQGGVIDRAQREDVMIYAVGLRSRGARPTPAPGPGGLQGMLLADLRTPGLRVSRRKPAAATSRFAAARISAPPSRAWPTSCTRNTCSGSPRPSATARCTTSVSASARAA